MNIFQQIFWYHVSSCQKHPNNIFQNILVSSSFTTHFQLKVRKVERYNYARCVFRYQILFELSYCGMGVKYFGNLTLVDLNSELFYVSQMFWPIDSLPLVSELYMVSNLSFSLLNCLCILLVTDATRDESVPLFS